MKPYIVRQGDYLTKLAGLRGVSAATVWNDSHNDALRKVRDNMDVLYPGDCIYLPEVPTQWLTLNSAASNSYQADLPQVEVGITLLGLDGTPLANVAYTMHGATGLVEGQTDGSGKATLLVSVDESVVNVVLEDGSWYCLSLGVMDPVTEPDRVQEAFGTPWVLHDHSDPRRPGEHRAQICKSDRSVSTRTGAHRDGRARQCNPASSRGGPRIAIAT